jgi:hypothetical protein
LRCCFASASCGCPAPEFENDACLGLGAEPPPTLGALAAFIVLLANSLRAVLDGYAELPNHVHGDAALDDDPSLTILRASGDSQERALVATIPRPDGIPGAQAPTHRKPARTAGGVEPPSPVCVLIPSGIRGQLALLLCICLVRLPSASPMACF